MIFTGGDLRIGLDSIESLRVDGAEDTGEIAVAAPGVVSVPRADHWWRSQNIDRLKAWIRERIQQVRGWWLRIWR